MILDGYTHHSQARAQQRSVPPIIVEYLVEFGTTIHAVGVEKLIFDKAARRRLERHLGGRRNLNQFTRWFNVCAVYSPGGYLITLTRSTKRHIRK
ncbi:hypothetical protein ACC810_27335 [Rhizobium ruizarguesonis]